MALLAFLPFLGVAVLANFGAENRTARWLTYAMLNGLNLTMIFGGLLTLLGSLMGSPQMSSANAAVSLVLTGTLASLLLLSGVRRLLARWLDIDPDSSVHTTALVFAVYFVGLTVFQLQIIGDLSQLALPESRLAWWDVVFGSVPLLLVALAGVGLGLRRNWRETAERLGLGKISARQMGVVAGAVLGLLALDYGVLWFWARVDPVGHAFFGGITANLFADLTAPGTALLVSLAAGITEEVLFRGALQPRFGLWLTAALFATGHFQYGLSLATLEVLVIGLLLGVLRQRTNTTACILVHLAYNFFDLILLPVFPY
ncbi:MAG: CPBP family intramembrane glutamic endopeptidase [Chloroflexota bacterium]|nr:CPBP family intramembrane glutamic endopeptidase [Chloroflexota bacterium]